jgi:hypothetical protein
MVCNAWAKTGALIFYQVEVQGLENLPPAGRPVVFVCNHQSCLVRGIGVKAGVKGCGPWVKGCGCMETNKLNKRVEWPVW